MSEKKMKSIIEMLEATQRLIKISSGVGGMTRVKEALMEQYGLTENAAYLLCRYVLQNVNI